jgi:hypothetical protein
VADGVWVQRSNARLELTIRLQETASLDLHRMGTQRPDPARIEVEPEIKERQRDGYRAWGAQLNRRGQPVFSHGPELCIAETRKGGGVTRVGWLQKCHTVERRFRDPFLPG